ncbi:hypothetical protein E2C01_083910 [Portunus trituberculatus]|uniref:Uncharacterized protein n=1 Tax=Portunus trituberculatus TaxID=210409 RepID=A0A5B7IYB0_PORTR|nr:hypothetical protein [Portunus trituberculatus]
MDNVAAGHCVLRQGKTRSDPHLELSEDVFTKVVRRSLSLLTRYVAWSGKQLGGHSFQVPGLVDRVAAAPASVPLAHSLRHPGN